MRKLKMKLHKKNKMNNPKNKIFQALLIFIFSISFANAQEVIKDTVKEKKTAKNGGNSSL